VVIGGKGFAMHYTTKKSKRCRFIAKVEGGAFLVMFYEHPSDAAQHTRKGDITGCSSKEESVQLLPPLPEPAETPFKVGEKVWALENGGSYKRGRIIHVFGAHDSALVMFFHPSELPSQNTKWKDISLTKPADK